MVDRPFPPRRHRGPTSSCARQPTRLTAQYSRRAPRHLNDIDSKGRLVRTIVYLFVAIVVLGTIATPGLGAFALVVPPLLGLGLLWQIALTVFTHGRPVDAVVHTRQSHLLGPGGARRPGRRLPSR
jgi:hypothetical protein